MSDFTGDVVYVTGAASGIGLGIAEAFYAAGASVSLGDFRADALETIRGRFADQQRVHLQEVDVRDEENVSRFFSTSEDAIGKPSIVIANAGIYPNTPVVDMPVDEWDRVMSTNVRGVFLTCQAAARSMLETGTQGSIITVSSGAASSARRGASHYCASKAGVEMFTKVLALEMGEHRINVNCIAPGAVVANSVISPTSDKYKEALLKSIPWGRMGQPDDIARAALFLASPDADFITGTVLHVDGGSSAGRYYLPLSSS